MSCGRSEVKVGGCCRGNHKRLTARPGMGSREEGWRGAFVFFLGYSKKILDKSRTWSKAASVYVNGNPWDCLGGGP